MWDKILDAVLAGSPWGIIAALGIVIWLRERRHDKQIRLLVEEKDELHKTLNGKIETLTGKYVKDMGEQGELRLKEAIKSNNDYNAAMGGVAKAMESIKAVIQSKRGTSQ